MQVKDYYNSKKPETPVNYNLKIIGIAGTVGKTTVCQLLYQYLLKLGKKVFLSSTSGFFAYDGAHCEDFGHSSPVYEYQLLYLLDESYKRGCEYFIMEMTAEATSRHIYEIVDIDVVGLTMFKFGTCKSFDTDAEYLAAKVSIFNLPNVKNVVVNSSHAEFVNAIQRDKIMFGGANDKYYLTDYKVSESGNLSVKVNFDRNDWIDTNLKSSINNDNLLCFLAIIDFLKLYDAVQIRNTLSNIIITGRLQTFELEGRTIMIDTGYDGIDGLKPFYEETKRPKTITVLSTYNFNTSEAEDVEELRKEKGKFFQSHSDILILTKTHRNFNNEMRNIEQMCSALKKNNSTFVVPERPQALMLAWEKSQPGDLITIIGKGDEIMIVNNDMQLTDEGLLKTIVAHYKNIEKK